MRFAGRRKRKEKHSRKQTEGDHAFRRAELKVILTTDEPNAACAATIDESRKRTQRHNFFSLRSLQCYPSESSPAAKIFHRACFSFLSPRLSGERIEERIPRTNSRIAPLNRSSRRESALTLFGIRWSGHTSAATRFMGRGIPASCRKRAPQPSPPWHGGEEFLVAATPRCVLSRPILLQENKDLQDCSTDEHGLDSAAGQRCYRKVGLFILF
jgi:hypothetical protein